jgi:RNA polymerase sigma-70 factor (ECF subfamily)
MKKDPQTVLAKKAVKGDVKAFEDLIKLEESKIFSFALSIAGGDRTAAEEIYQEALIKAFRSIHNFSFKSSFSTWLWKIIRNAYYDYLKAEKKMSGISIDDSGYEPSLEDKKEMGLIRDDRAALLRKLISCLPVSYSEVITLIDIQELDHDEVALMLDIEKNLLKVRLHRARNKLKELIEENEEFFK